MVSPPGFVTRDDLEDPEDRGGRASWVFWLLLVAALVPLVTSIATVHRVLFGPEFEEAFGGTLEVTAKDRWALVLNSTDLTLPSVATALALLALGVAARSSRVPFPPAARVVVAGSCALGAAWNGGTAVLAGWAALGTPTERQERDLALGVTGFGPYAVLPDVLLGVFLTVLHGAVAVLLLRRRSHQRVARDAVEGATAE